MSGFGKLLGAWESYFEGLPMSMRKIGGCIRILREYTSAYLVAFNFEQLRPRRRHMYRDEYLDMESRHE
ncbi:hypothetical protein VTN00DRAFT_3697 [Thermoascus crustaceus]|uniref:uncharacterized protein n=1 Tax=Thermoascus crustaceus TaxID=5088 RepID=UPI003744A98A